MLIFIYSGLFTASEAKHPVPSFYEEVTGKQSPSAGMSRAFSELVRGKIYSARKYNEDSPLIFAFFLLQLTQRMIVSLLLIKTNIRHSGLLIADIAFSTVLFLYCFKGQILKMLEIIMG
jgi:hypothetical protein